MSSILVITDPTTHPKGDDTPEIYRSLAADPDVNLYHADPHYMGAGNYLPAVEVERGITYERFITLNSSQAKPLPVDRFDLIWDRTDKPRPAAYMDRIIELERITKFVNRPSGLGEVSCRSFARRHFDRYLPRGVMTRDADEAAAFIRAEERVVAKQDVSYGGKAVYRISRHAEAGWLLEGLGGLARRFPTEREVAAHLFTLDTESFEFVVYLDRVHDGDKRVLALEGRVLGAILRKSSDGSWINNLSCGGHAILAEVTDDERLIVDSTYPLYAERGVDMLGYDFLVGEDGHWRLSEINAGNVGGYTDLAGLGHDRCFRDILAFVKSRAAR